MQEIYHPYLFLPIEDLLDSSLCEVGGTPLEAAAYVPNEFSSQSDDCYIATGIAGRSSAVADTNVGAISFREGYVDGTADQYSGELDIHASYLAFDVEFFSGLRLHVGYREEKSTQLISISEILLSSRESRKLAPIAVSARYHLLPVPKDKE